MRALTGVLGVLALGLALGAQAGHPQDTSHQYRWVDATGLPHYSDSLSVKALKYGYDVLDANGMVVRHVDAEKSASERKLAAARAARVASSEKAARRREQRDRQLLSAYPDEAAFKASQQARLDDLDERIRTTRMNLDSQERNLAQLLDHASEYTTRDKDVPDKLAGRIAHQREAVASQRRLIKDQKARKDEARQQLAANLEHYREVRAREQERYGN